MFFQNKNTVVMVKKIHLKMREIMSGTIMWQIRWKIMVNQALRFERYTITIRKKMMN